MKTFQIHSTDNFIPRQRLDCYNLFPSSMVTPFGFTTRTLIFLHLASKQTMSSKIENKNMKYHLSKTWSMLIVNLNISWMLSNLDNSTSPDLSLLELCTDLIIKLLFRDILAHSKYLFWSIWWGIILTCQY